MPKEQIEEVLIEKEMQKAYIDYAMSVIVSRAIPDVADGLKPVQRRILYSMHAMGLHAEKPTRKSARIVGDVLGKFHPHGDSAVYEALARMTQDFSLRYPLIKGQGNFGSIDGDPPAAQRYTEAKLAKISANILTDIDKDTVDFQPNFDNSVKEPKVLPATLPNLLINGASGIAVGMATNIPPHNLTEILDGLIEYINNPEISLSELMKIIQGPDFPTAGIIYKEGIEDLYSKGRGSFTLRAKTNIEEKGNKQAIIITELPYQVNKSNLITDIAKLVKDKKVTDISNIRDESAKGKIRVVIEIRRGGDANVILNKLHKLTQLQTRFNGILLAILNGIPKLMTLKDFLHEFINHRKVVVNRRTKFELKKAEERIHIVEGLLLALKDIDSIVSLIKKSSSVSEAAANLVKKFKLSEKQAESILEMRLSRLTSLEHKKLKDEEKTLIERIKDLQKILSSENEILKVVKKELQDLKNKYGDDRRSKLMGKLKVFEDKELINKENVAVTLTAKGYIKRMPLDIYREQRRGGRGSSGTELTSGDALKETFVCSTHDYLLFFTNRGRVFSLQSYQVPEATKYAKGKAIVNLLGLKDEVVATTLAVADFESSLILATKKGMLKKMDLKNFSKINKNGIIAITLPSDDELIDALFLQDKGEIFLGTNKGIAIRFPATGLRSVGRTAYGVKGIKLGKDDFVIGAEVINPSKEDLSKVSMLTVTESGYGKRTLVDKYRKTARAGKGITNLKVTPKTGNVAGIIKVVDKLGVIVTTKKGMVIRTSSDNIRQAGRSTQGVKVIRVSGEDKVIALASIKEESN